MSLKQRIKLAVKQPLLTIYGLYRISFLFFTKPLSYLLKDILYSHHYIFGGGFNNNKRVKIAKTAIINNAFLNVNSGCITIKDYVFFGHNVSIITGTHDYNVFNYERIIKIPSVGFDIIIEEGVWVGANSTILGPCTIGKHAVIASGAIVTRDNPPYEIRGGVPARFMKRIVI